MWGAIIPVHSKWLWARRFCCFLEEIVYWDHIRQNHIWQEMDFCALSGQFIWDISFFYFITFPIYIWVLRSLGALQTAEKFSVGGGPTQVSRVKYVTQVSSRPPKFVMFVSGSSKFPETSSTFIKNALRQHFGFAGVPLRIDVRVKEPRAKPGPSRLMTRASQARQAWGQVTLSFTVRTNTWSA